MSIVRLLYCTKSITQNIRGVTEILLRAAQRMLGSFMRLLEQCLRTIVLRGVHCK